MGLDATQFVLEVEDAFDITIPDDDLGNLVTVGDLCDYIVERKPGTDLGEALEIVRQIAVNELSVRPEEVQMASRWIEDLKLD